jgi:putative spermidine/putrescine transport system substrate-binding protein
MARIRSGRAGGKRREDAGSASSSPVGATEDIARRRFAAAPAVPGLRGQTLSPAGAPRAQAITRRELLRRAGGGALALGLAGGAAACGAEEAAEPDAAPEPLGPPFEGTLRILGTSGDLLQPIRDAAHRDIVFGTSFSLAAPGSAGRAALERPDRYDLALLSSAELAELTAAGRLHPLERERLPYWWKVMSLFKLGRYDPADVTCGIGQGDAPFRVLYLREGRPAVWTGAGIEPALVAGSPAALTIDAFAYDADALRREPREVSWAELLNPAWAGRVALPDDPVAGFQTAALAARALHLLEVANAARPSRSELDALARLLLERRRAGHFRAFWRSGDGAVDLLAGREVVLCPVPPPGLLLLQASGAPVRAAAPPEGFRARATLFAASPAAARDPSRLQACHDFASWWLSGLPGAIELRRGTIDAALQVSLETRWISEDEWAYWVAGKPAPSDLDTVFGEGAIPTGATLDTGSLRERACRIAVWESSFRDEAEHAEARWGEVVAG